MRRWFALLPVWAALCAVPSDAEIRLVDGTAEAGVAAAGGGNGAAFGDLDGDGWLDLLVSRNSHHDAALLYRNNGDGTFAADAFDWEPAVGAVGALIFDVDGDADQDIYVVVHQGPNQLHRNEGGRWVEVQRPQGFFESGNAMGAFFADLDDDGAVDLLTTHRYWYASQWLHALGTPAMADLAPLASPLRSGNDVFGATPFDFDGDADLDVYVVALGSPNLLHRNDGGGAFHTVPGAVGLDSDASSIAALPADADGDGRLDLFVANAGRQANHLFLRRGEGAVTTYADVASAAGVAGSDNTSGGAWVDLDNDGDEDLVLSNVSDPLRVYRNDGGDSPRFAEVGGEILGGTELPAEGTTGVAVGDIDRDGDVDLFLTTPGSGDVLLRNEAGPADWLEVDLGGDARLSGTRVEVRAGASSQVRSYVVATSIGTQHGDLLHFGLGSATDSVQVAVEWPSGQRQDLRVPARSVVRLREATPPRDLALVRVAAPGLAPGWEGFAPRVVVANRGAVATGGDLTAAIAGPGRSWERRLAVPVLDPGDSVVVTFDVWRPDRAGLWDVTLRLDGGDDVAANDGWRRDYHFHEFRDVAPDLGVDDPGRGWAGAFADYDNDGDLDLYVSNGGSLGEGENVLYRNDGDAGFRDVTAAAGVADAGNGTGVVFADFDRDGNQDLYISKGGFLAEGQANRLFHNRGDGTFVDASLEAGFDAVRSSYAAIVGDYDRDGYLDLLVSQLRGQEVTFYRNRSGRFEDVTRSKQIQSFFRYSTSAGAFSDYDNDGDVDLYVGVFGDYDRLYADIGDTAYAASQVGDTGDMVGVTVGDYDGDADLDIYTVNRNGRSALYENLLEVTSMRDVGAVTGTENKAFGSGCAFIDHDGDGDLDLWVVNSIFPDRLYVNLGDGTFVDRAAAFGLGDTVRTRSVLVGDVDNDGDADAYVINEGLPNRLYANGGGSNGWLQATLQGTDSNPDAVGARLTAWVDGRPRLREVNGTSGMSYSSRVVHVGLGQAAGVDSLHVSWPSGRLDRHGPLAANTSVRLVEGGALTAVAESGAAVPADLHLSEVYPNPFNASAVVAFDLPRAGAVDVAVYNALGQRVRTLLRDPGLAAGSQRLTWDGHDAADRAVASGVYYVRLEALDRRLIRSMVLVR